MVRLYFSVVFIFCSILSYSQRVISLYPAKIPNSTSAPNEEEIVFNAEVDTLAYKVSKPTLTMFLPPKDNTNSSAVIICPGGGYHVLLMNREGSNIAREFNKHGVAAFVLKYRLPDDKFMPDKSIGPLQDAQQAILMVREHASEWNIDPNRIGIMGFSAGGHLASTAGTHFENSLIENKKGTSLRPDFMILIYPVISFLDSIGHMGSREYLIGKTPSIERIQYFSNEYHVSGNTPPTFITAAGDDSVVHLSNSLIFYNTLLKNSVSAELHIYAKGEHGFLKQPPFEEWFGRCCYWMKSNGLMQIK
jgi:acetyl esterase/lipase